MRNWEIPALLATMTVGGLTSLFAQGTGSALPVEPMPTPVLSAPVLGNPSPVPVVVPTDIPAPVTNSPAPVVEQVPPSPMPEPAPVYSSAPIESNVQPVESVPAAAGCCGTGSIQQAPVSLPTPGCSTCGQAVAPMTVSVQPAVTSGCGCQGGNGYSNYSVAPSFYPSVSQVGNHGIYGVYGVYGSGSGVASGLLSPVANSGGLHARYPYYNYRHSWYYQGPASQNVTIVW